MDSIEDAAFDLNEQPPHLSSVIYRYIYTHSLPYVYFALKGPFGLQYHQSGTHKVGGLDQAIQDVNE